MILGPGGENVFPEDIETEINKLPMVRDSAVIGVEEKGHTLIHAVLLCEADDGERIVSLANQHLAPHQRIVGWSIWPAPDFPRSATRKVMKDEILRWVRSRRELQPQSLDQVTPLVRVLADLTEKDARLIKRGTKIVPELGLDSLLRIELVSAIEEQFNVTIEENSIDMTTTVGELEHDIHARSVQPLRITKYPRWSLSPWAGGVRPLVRRLLFFSWLPWLCQPVVYGTELLEDLEGPLIFMANHRSFLDAPLAVYAIPTQLRHRLAVAAATAALYKSYWWFAPLAELAFNAYPFPNEVNENIKPALEYTGRLLDDGWSLLVFPEGQLNRTDKPIQALKAGTGVLAVEMQATVVPMAILGSDKILPPDTLVPHRRDRVVIRYGQPLRIPAADTYAEATERIAGAIAALL